MTADTVWCVGPAPFRQAQGPERACGEHVEPVEGLAAPGRSLGGDWLPGQSSVGEWSAGERRPYIQFHDPGSALRLHPPGIERIDPCLYRQTLVGTKRMNVTTKNTNHTKSESWLQILK
jgi:hypothetical protein